MCRGLTWYTVKTNVELCLGSVIVNKTPTTIAAPASSELLALQPL